MRVHVQKWGNSLAVRIPKPFAEDAEVHEGTELDLSMSEGKLVATPVKKRRPRLKELLARITKDNVHGEVDSGEPVGREVL